MPGARHESGRFYAGLILAVLAFLVAVEVYGFRHANLFAQKWARGLARLLNSERSIGAATALLILVPWAFAGRQARCLFTAIGIGPIAFLAVIFFLLSAWSLGDLIVGRTPWSAADAPVGLLSLLAGMAVYIFLMPFAARLPMNYPWVYAVVLAVPILANRPRVRLPAAVPLRSWGERLGCAAFLFVLITHWFAMLGPEASADGLAMHLAIRQHRGQSHADLRPGPLSLGGHADGRRLHLRDRLYLLGGEMAARLLNFAISPCCSVCSTQPCDAGFRPASPGSWSPSSPPRRWCNWSPARCSSRICWRHFCLA
jgi:hypothetical protein